MISCCNEVSLQSFKLVHNKTATCKKSKFHVKINVGLFEIEWTDGDTTYVLILDMKKGNLYNQLMNGVAELHPNFKDYLKWEGRS